MVTATGGLADSVCDTTDLSLKNNIATGFVVKSVTSASLLVTIRHAIEVWQDKKTWRKIQKNGMTRDISWASSANAYLDCYKKAVERELA